MRRGRTWAVLLSVTGLLAAATVVAAPSTAGEAGDYPEFPYPVTNYQEDNRGQFHFSSRAGWMNDVNAPLYYNGTYHLYYQHNPHGLVWDTMHWGHATSTDLVHWQQQPIALEPGVHPGNLFSGGGVVDRANTSGLKSGDEDPIVVFSGTDGVTVFYSNDGGYTFSTYDGGNPVVRPAGTSRDPKVFWDEPSQQWVMVVWSDEGGNGVNFYASDDLLHWDFASRYRADWLFECPNIVPMPLDGDASRTEYVLSDASGEYVVGDFDGTTFRTDQAAPKRLNEATSAFNGSYYAGLTFQNMPDDRVVSMAWQPGNSGTIWTGNATFPVEMRLVSSTDGPRVLSTPVEEITGARTSTRTWKGANLSVRSADQLLAGVQADTYEVEATFDVGKSAASTFGFRLHTSPDGWSDRDVMYDVAAGTLDGSPLPAIDGKVTVRLLVDRGQLEIFGNDGRLYKSLNVNFDSLPGGDGIGLVTDGRLRMSSLAIHQIGSTWAGGQSSTLRTNLTGSWYAASGSWSDVPGGKQGQSSGDAFYLNTQTGDDFVYEGDVTLTQGVAAAISFRATKDASRHYTVNIDADAGVVKLWRPGRDIATFRTPIELGRTYHLTVRAEGSHLQVWFDGSAAPVIDAVDDTISSGQFGLNVFHGTGVMQDVRVSPLP